MASSAQTIVYLLEQLQDAGTISSRRMFGEYAIYCEGKTVALVCDDQLFVKMTEKGADYVGDITEGVPFPGAKPWILIDGDLWEDAEWLCGLIRTTATALPMPKPKKKKPKK